MGFLSDNVIPGNHGTTFETNAMEPHELEMVKNFVLQIDGIMDCILDVDVFPREFTVHTSKTVLVADIENKLSAAGYHAFPKRMFELF